MGRTAQGGQPGGFAVQPGYQRGIPTQGRARQALQGRRRGNQPQQRQNVQNGMAPYSGPMPGQPPQNPMQSLQPQQQRPAGGQQFGGMGGPPPGFTMPGQAPAGRPAGGIPFGGGQPPPNFTMPGQPPQQPQQGGTGGEPQQQNPQQQRAMAQKLRGQNRNRSGGRGRGRNQPQPAQATQGSRGPVMMR